MDGVVTCGFAVETILLGYLYLTVMRYARHAKPFNHQRFFLLRSINRCYSSTKPMQPPTFESIGVDEFVTRGLEKAFPHIQIPTPTQEQFIPAILSGKDVLIQDRTGTGK
jgi:hypothetical protein